tara:strand:- start:509 stop:730 length:222 start_codon:yes stop_codon:yes gene_type:complete
MTELERVDALISALRSCTGFQGRNSQVRQQYNDVVKTIPHINIPTERWNLIDRLKNDKLEMPFVNHPFNYFKS